jgi:hypothetical protein
MAAGLVALTALAAAALATAIAGGAMLLTSVRPVAAGTALMIGTAEEADTAQISPACFATAVGGAMLAVIAVRTAFAARFATRVPGAVTRPFRRSPLGRRSPLPCGLRGP